MVIDYIVAVVVEDLDIYCVWLINNYNWIELQWWLLQRSHTWNDNNSALLYNNVHVSLNIDCVVSWLSNVVLDKVWTIIIVKYFN